MAIAIANLGASAGTTEAAPDIRNVADATSYANASWTPPSTGIVVCIVINGQNTVTDTTVDSLIHNGVSFTRIGTDIQFSSSQRRISVFACYASSLSTGVTTASFGTDTQLFCYMSFFQITGADESGAVTNAFISATGTTGSGTTASITLAAGQNSDSRTLTAAGWVTNAEPAIEAGYTKLDGFNGSGPTMGFLTQWHATTFDTAPTATTGSTGNWGMRGLEIKAAASGTAHTLDATDTVSLADAAPTFDDGLGLADTMTLADTAPAWDGSVNPADTLALADAAPAWDDTVTLADTLALADSGVFDIVMALDLADTLPLADAAPTWDDTLTLADPLVLADLFDSAWAIDVQLTDSFTFVDALDPGFGIGLADTLALLDALAIDDGLVLADALALADVLVLDESWGLADNLGLLDVVVFDDGLGLTDTVGLADTFVGDVSNLTDIAEADVLPLIDLLDVAAGYDLSATDAVALVDALGLDLDLQLADTMALVDAFALAFDLAFDDAFTFADAFATDQTTTFADSVTLVDDSSAIGFLLTLDLTDSMTLTDAPPTLETAISWLAPLPPDSIVLVPATPGSIT